MNKCSVDISGMHCRSCEILIEDELKKIPGVNEAYVNHKNGTATIKFAGDLHETDVIRAVESAGYTYGRSDGKEKKLISFDARIYRELGIAGVVSLGLFLLAKQLGLFNLSAGVSGNYSSLPVVFLIGITAGVSTCMALVGGLVLGSSARFAKKHPEASGMGKFKPHLFFNLGRILSYFVLGGLIGFLGSVFQLSTSVLGIMTVGVGLVMLLLGTQLIDMFPILKSISFTIPKSVSRFFGIKNRADRDYTHKNSAVLGALTFFLPCGFTQAMQIYAMSTGSVVAGSLTMGVFALGTAPGLLGVGGLAAAIKGQASGIFFKTAGIVVIALSFFNITNGLNLLGVDVGSVTTKASPTAVVNKNVKIVDGVQEVRMRQVSSGYVPNSFTIRKDLPVRWIINSEDSNTCASSIVSQKLGVRQGLKRGENIIEFTPSEVGTIRFSCSMGMYTGSFTVVDDDSPGATLPVSNVVFAHNPFKVLFPASQIIVDNVFL
jgi:sulfite exporter TauE/SafE/copper chaperone CopZ